MRLIAKCKVCGGKGHVFEGNIFGLDPMIIKKYRVVCDCLDNVNIASDAFKGSLHKTRVEAIDAWNAQNDVKPRAKTVTRRVKKRDDARGQEFGGFVTYDNLEDLKAVPSEDVVRVIRCKDCKFCTHWYADKGLCHLWDGTGIDVFEDGFCSYGKKRESASEKMFENAEK